MINKLKVLGYEVNRISEVYTVGIKNERVMIIDNNGYIACDTLFKTGEEIKVLHRLGYVQIYSGNKFVYISGNDNSITISENGEIYYAENDAGYIVINKETYEFHVYIVKSKDYIHDNLEECFSKSYYGFDIMSAEYNTIEHVIALRIVNGLTWDRLSMVKQLKGRRMRVFHNQCEMLNNYFKVGSQCYDVKDFTKINSQIKREKDAVILNVIEHIM